MLSCGAFRAVPTTLKSFLLRRLLLSLPVLLGVCTLVFALIHLIPGDPIQVMLGEGASAADVKDLRSRLGLDRPLMEQYGHYLSNLAAGDLGTSLRYREPVAHLIVERYPATLLLAGASLLLACLISFPAGILAAVHPGTAWDRIASTLALLGLSLPSFWVGPLLILIFSVHLDWFPVSGMEEPAALVLPSLALGSALAAILARMIRASLLEEISSPYSRAAAARGLGRWKVVLRHAMKNAFIPVLTILGLQLGVLLTGAVITETVFGWPGLGRLTIQAIETRDYPLVQGCILSIAFSYVVVNLMTDVAYAFFDPRIRLG